MRKKLSVLTTAALLAACAAPAKPAPRACFHGDVQSETDTGYCQAVRSGRTLHISGVPARGPMPEALKKVYDRLGKVLAAQGLSYANVVRETVYTTDIEALIKAKDIRGGYYGETLPAATWVQIERLFVPEFVVEVELTAEYPE